MTRLDFIPEENLIKNIEYDFDGYPCWICDDCALGRGHKRKCRMSTYHTNLCGWCEQLKSVTEPRDYSFPKFQKKL